MERSAVKSGLPLPLLYHRIPKTGIFVRKNGLFFPQIFRIFSAARQRDGKIVSSSFLLYHRIPKNGNFVSSESQICLNFVSQSRTSKICRKYVFHLPLLYHRFSKTGVFVHFYSTYFPLIFHFYSSRAGRQGNCFLYSVSVEVLHRKSLSRLVPLLIITDLKKVKAGRSNLRGRSPVSANICVQQICR